MTDAQQAQLQAWREALDGLDDALLDVLARRAALVDTIWTWKRAEGLPVRDGPREVAVIERLLAKAVARDLDAAAVRPVLEAIVGRSLTGR